MYIFWTQWSEMKSIAEGKLENSQYMELKYHIIVQPMGQRRNPEGN